MFLTIIPTATTVRSQETCTRTSNDLYAVRPPQRSNFPTAIIGRHWWSRATYSSLAEESGHEGSRTIGTLL